MLFLAQAFGLSVFPPVFLDVPDTLPTDGVVRTTDSEPVQGLVPVVVEGPDTPFQLELHPTANDPAGFIPTYRVWSPPEQGWVPGAVYTVTYGPEIRTFTALPDTAADADAQLYAFEPSWCGGTCIGQTLMDLRLDGDEHSWAVLGPDVGIELDVYAVGAFSEERTITEAWPDAGDWRCLRLWAFSGSGEAGNPGVFCFVPPGVDPPDPIDPDLPAGADPFLEDVTLPPCGCRADPAEGALTGWLAPLLRRR
ncbi:MAG: hypothetical protein H6734_17610 [Alphaproteobacteria bacterium]|nr:hypothetical protein [Alphaproteobacteria bacterium]